MTTDGAPPASAWARLRERERLTLLVTDSGLGGLSVVADLERRARASRRLRELDLQFVSALPETGRGYNQMATRARQLEVFDHALVGMSRLAVADALLVACNTLSVLIPSSRALAASPLPVMGIVELGVAAIAQRLVAAPAAAVAIFATETTIAVGTHRELLLERGFEPDRILPVACPGLASRIELEGPSAGVRSEIGRFAELAVAAAGRGRPLVAALACTHYGFCAGEFARALEAAGAGPIEVVDPNRWMAALVVPDEAGEAAAGGGGAQIRVRVVSRAIPLAGEVASTAALLEPISPATAAALRGYELRRDLFAYEETPAHAR